MQTELYGWSEHGFTIHVGYTPKRDQRIFGFDDQFERINKDDPRGIEYTGHDPSLRGNHYRPLQTSYLELVDSYTKAGRDDPEGDAYRCIQKDLNHYLDGYELLIEFAADYRGLDLWTDALATGFSHHLDATEEEEAECSAKAHFGPMTKESHMKRAIRMARRHHLARALYRAETTTETLLLAGEIEYSDLKRPAPAWTKSTLCQKTMDLYGEREKAWSPDKP